MMSDILEASALVLGEPHSVLIPILFLFQKGAFTPNLISLNQTLVRF